MGKDLILVVEDEADIRELVRYNLSKAGFLVEDAESGEEGLRKALADVPHLILLDLMLPGLDGITVCRRIRSDSRTASVPVVILTAKGEDADIVAGLEAGADDYVTKPFSPRVLVARVRAVLRRRSGAGNDEDPVIAVGGIVIDTLRHEARVGGVVTDLTASQFAILLFLARKPGWVFTRGQIIEAVKGDDYPVTDRSVDVQILNLRRKLGAAGDTIETVRGVGYRFRE